jgi:DNA-binding MarR family transcriptional regulator
MERSDAELFAGRAMDGLRRIVHALHLGTSASERAVGLSSAQLFVLRQLHAVSEQSLGDLARRTRTTQSSVSEVVARLVRRGLVAREPSTRDRRRAVLTLTAAGAALVATAPETVQDRLVAGFGRLDPDAQRALAEAIEAWLAMSGLADVRPKFFFEPNDQPLSESTPGSRGQSP